MISPRQLPPWAPTKTERGVWWPKGRPDLRYTGVLAIEDGTFRLTITAPPIGQEVFAMGSAATLYGEIYSETGSLEVTLWARSDDYLDHASNGTEHSRRITHVVEGAHLDDRDVALFGVSAVIFHDLGMWGRFRTPIPQGTPESDLPLHTVGILEPYGDLFDTRYSVTVNLEHPARVETNEDFPNGAIINHRHENARVVFEVTPPAPARFHDLLASDMQALLTFCYQSGAPLRGAWMGSPGEDLRPYYRRDSYKDRIVRRLGDSQMILTPGQSSFGHLAEVWWSILDAFFPAPQVLTSYLHASRGLLEQSTASALAATESIHAKIGPTQTRFPIDLIDEKKRAIKQALPGSTNGSFRAFVGEKLRENRPTLDTRLHELVEIVTPERFAMLSIDTSEWIAKFKDVRNKLAHTGAHVPRRGDSSDDLERVNSQTRPILALLLLSEMGLPVDALDRAADALGAYPHRSW